MLFIDAFPLQKHDAPRAELEAVLQRQFDALAKLLVDPEPTVRVVGVHGVCRVLGVFWELIPAATTKSLLTQLVTKLAYDVRTAWRVGACSCHRCCHLTWIVEQTRSTAVRAAVFQGLEYVLDNALSYPVMKMVLPALSQSIHDRSERVRKAVVSMLLAVLRIRDIHFADIVSVDNLLARLVLDSECHTIASGITQLLQPSFMPQVGDVAPCSCGLAWIVCVRVSDRSPTLALTIHPAENRWFRPADARCGAHREAPRRRVRVLPLRPRARAPVRGCQGHPHAVQGAAPRPQERRRRRHCRRQARPQQGQGQGQGRRQGTRKRERRFGSEQCWGRHYVHVQPPVDEGHTGGANASWAPHSLKVVSM